MTAGTEEFDSIQEEYTKAKKKRYPFQYFFLLSIVIFLMSSVLICRYRYLLRHFITNTSQNLVNTLSNLRLVFSKQRFQNSEVDVIKLKCNQICGSSSGDEVPVKLLWQGGTLVESSIHCNITEDSADSKVLHLQKQILQTKVLMKCSDAGGGDEKQAVSPTSSEESTAFKIAEIRKLLESESEIINALKEKHERIANHDSLKRVEDKFGTHKMAKLSPKSLRRMSNKKLVITDITNEDDQNETNGRKSLSEKSPRTNLRSDRYQIMELEQKKRDMSPDPKLMDRIRILENRLKQEEIKNENWINRISRAEGIIQQLNKQVQDHLLVRLRRCFINQGIRVD